MKSSLPFDSYLQDMAYKYGQNIGIAFQLVDDWLDFMSSADMLGEKKFFKSFLAPKGGQEVSLSVCPFVILLAVGFFIFR